MRYAALGVQHDVDFEYGPYRIAVALEAVFDEPRRQVVVHGLLDQRTAILIVLVPHRDVDERVDVRVQPRRVPLQFLDKPIEADRQLSPACAIGQPDLHPREALRQVGMLGRHTVRARAASVPSETRLNR